MSQRPEPKHVFYTHKDITSDYYQTIIAKGRPKWCKLIWFVLTIGFLGITIYLVQNLVRQYLEFKSFDKISVEWKSSLTLPAITICSTNFLDYKEFKEQMNDETTTLLDSFLNAVSNYGGSDGIEEYVDIKIVKEFDAELRSRNNFTVSIFEEFQFDPDFFMLGERGVNYYKAKFAGKWIGIDLGQDGKDKNESDVARTRRAKNIISHKYGSCIVLNDDKSLVQRLGGPQGGFTIDLDAKLAHYSPTTKTKGFMVYLRNPNETLIVDEGGILVSPGTETFIGLSKSEVTRLGPRFGDCKNVSSKFVPEISKSVRECIQEKELEMSVKLCHCIPWYLNNILLQLDLTEYIKEWEAVLQNNEDEVVCGFATQTLCDVRVLEELSQNNNNNNNRGKSCPEPCYFEEYDWHINVGDFPPTEAYWEQNLLQEKILDQSENTFEYAEKNFVRIHIYYEDIKVTQKEQEKAYEMKNAIAEVAGFVDMMIGLSCFTVFQIIEIMIVWACCCATKRTRSEENNDNVMENQVYNLPI